MLESECERSHKYLKLSIESLSESEKDNAQSEHLLHSYSY